MGNALDELGRGSEAIETYRAAIKLNPRVALLHYNLAVSLRRAGKQPEAKAAVEKALQCDPARAGSHLVLGAIYQTMGYRVPAILAYSRFLVLEPESPRSAQVLPALHGLLTQGVGKGKQPNDITIFVSETPKGRKDEGDFMSAEMMMSIVLAADLIVKPPDAEKAPESAYQKLSSLYSSLGEALGNSKAKRGFAATYYAPYFAALKKAGHAEAFTAHAWKSASVDGASDWAGANQAKIEAFLGWSKAYQWPAK
jgi:tetratricopeptide (TPR) repeat protein